MKLEKAIERLTDETVQLRRGISPGWIEAVQLGIEALKYIVYRDNCPGVNTRLLLPGETED